MQDILRDDLSLLNGVDVAGHSSDKDICSAVSYKIQKTSNLIPKVTNLSKESNNNNREVASIAPVKLEDINTIELHSNSSSWKNYNINELGDHRIFLDSCSSFVRNGTKLLLQGSDDPLISHGANSVLYNDDEHPADFARSLIIQPDSKFHKQNEQTNVLIEPKMPQRLVKSGCSNLTRQQLKVKANLMSARNQQRHQTQTIVTPQNTLAIASDTNQKNQSAQKTKYKKGATVKLRFHHQALPPEYLSHYEATQGQQKTTTNQMLNSKIFNQRNTSKTVNTFPKQTQPKNSNENVRSWLQKIAEIQKTANASNESTRTRTVKHIEKQECKPSTYKTHESKDSLISVSEYDNNNCRAQKALETQNAISLSHSTMHGDTFLASSNKSSSSKRSHLSDLPFMGEITLDNCKPRRGRKPKKADICHLIYKNYGTILPKKFKPEKLPDYNLSMRRRYCKAEVIEQPLNLCLRDQLNDSYSISSGDELSETNSSCPTPVSTSFDYARDSMLANNLKNSLRNLNEPSESEKISMSENEGNILDRPITISYRKLLESGTVQRNRNGRYKTVKKDNQLSLKIPVAGDFLPPQKPEQCLPSPVDINVDNTEEAFSKSSSLQSKNTLAKNLTMNQNEQIIAPQKRKRSAIFIPPMNVENINNPATEVSICKFKFTGGSKPTLQEKKMISVDAGGNYRYFSGTGDKASRGYEYFPRESLQQTAGLLPGVNCTAQKLCITIPPSSGNELQHTSESSSPSAAHLATSSINVNTDLMSSKSSSLRSSAAAAETRFEVSKNEACSLYITENSQFSSSSPTTLTNPCTVKPRKDANAHQAKKLSQKEQIINTFKKQGFLIQTQKLESAEGATYCKFRQLKKLTRYLFRNWKDYLPNDNSNSITSNTDSSFMTSVYKSSNETEQPATNQPSK